MNDIESPALARVREAVTPIVSDLGLDLYDLEQRGGTVHITIDTPPGSGSGVTIESLSLVHRLLDKQLDQEGDLLTKFGLEVSSPGVERSLRRPEHFRREVGKVVAIRLSDVESADRRLQGELVAADDTGVTVRLDAGDRSVALHPDRPCPHRVRVGPHAQAGPRTEEGTDHACRSAGRGSIRRRCAPMSNLDMSEAIRLLAQEKGLSEDSLLHVLVDALASAYKRRPGAADEVVVEVDPQTMDFTFTAYDLDEDGNWVNERDDTPRREELGRIAAQTFRQVMSQRIREVERDRKFEEYANREGDIVTGIIQQTDTRYTLLDLGRVEALLPQAEQVPFERPQPGDRSKAYIVEVRKTAKGPQIVVSRTHPGLIKRLFELEVPEIADGIVEIKACAREPGHRTKIAVCSNDHNVDPVGACVGARGGRVRMVVNELRGEKIDIVPFSDDITDFIAKALSPAKVSQVIVSDDGTQADVIVPDHQLSLAIGREGQNARLAARLTGVRIDIRSESQLADGVPARSEGLEEGVEYAEGQWIQNAESGEMEWHAADGTVMSEAQWNEAAANATVADAEVASDDAVVDEAEADAADAPAVSDDAAETIADDSTGDEAQATVGEPADAEANEQDDEPAVETESDTE